MLEIRRTRSIMKFLFLVTAFVILLFYPIKSEAYLDPGTGSFMLQMLGAAILGGVFSIKIFWQRIVNFFSKKKEDE